MLTFWTSDRKTGVGGSGNRAIEEFFFPQHGAHILIIMTFSVFLLHHESETSETLNFQSSSLRRLSQMPPTAESNKAQEKTEQQGKDTGDLEMY